MQNASAFFIFFMEKNRSNCPLSCTLDILGDKWSLLIIRDVIWKGKVSYSEFLLSEEKIATNILANRLKMLEEESILIKEVSATNKSKFEYRLTQKGADLLPILVEMADWSVKHNESAKASALGQRIAGKKMKFLKEIQSIIQERINNKE